MASPQVKNGFTAIANEVMEALAGAALTGREFRVLVVVLRKTWGWQKKSDRISGSQIAKLTGIDRRHVASLLKALERRSFLVRTEGKTQREAWMVRFNKNHEEWEKDIHNFTHSLFTSTSDGASTSTVEGASLAPSKVSVLAPRKVHTKEINKEESIKERKRSPFSNEKGMRPIGDIIGKRHD